MDSCLCSAQESIAPANAHRSVLAAATATVAANSAVMAPTHATRAGGQLYEAASIGFIRASRYTPAVTIVAA